METWAERRKFFFGAELNISRLSRLDNGLVERRSAWPKNRSHFRPRLDGRPRVYATCLLGDHANDAETRFPHSPARARAARRGSLPAIRVLHDSTIRRGGTRSAPSWGPKGVDRRGILIAGRVAVGAPLVDVSPSGRTARNDSGSNDATGAVNTCLSRNQFDLPIRILRPQ